MMKSSSVIPMRSQAFLMRLAALMSSGLGVQFPLG